MITPKSAYRSPELTPPSPMLKAKRALEDSDTEGEGSNKRRRATSKGIKAGEADEADDSQPKNEAKEVHQNALLLHGPKQRYQLADKHQIPALENNREMLVKVQAIGLNPIDWKAP